MLKNICKMAFAILMIVSFSHTALLAKESIIVGFYKDLSSSERVLIENSGGVIKHTYKLIPAISMEIAKERIEKLKGYSFVKYIEEDKSVVSIKKLSKKSQRAYQNSFFQNDISGDEYQNSLGVSKINSKVAHDKNITGKGVKIAILDSGINYNHQDLKDNYSGGHNFIMDANSSDPYDDGWNTHGTHMAGIIAAKNNGVGVVGVAPSASIYAVKVLDYNGFGMVSDVIAGIEWAVSNDMDIANISISGIDSDVLEATCDAAQDEGLLIIASAGNSYGESALFPASYDSVVAVGSVDAENKLGFFSPIDTAVEIVAPGLDILSTSKDNGYDIMSGTSQSTAFVSGVAALIISSGVRDINEDGEINNLDVREKLQISALDLGEIGRDDKFGYGLVDANSSLFVSSLPILTEDTYEQGYKDAQDAGFAEGRDDSCGYKIWNIDANLTYDTKYNDGYAVGYIEAYDKGWESCKNVDNNSSDNNNSSYDDGFKSAQDAGFTDGKNDSCGNDVWSIGVFLSFDTDYDIGYADGYIKAYDDGWESCRSDEDKLSYDEGFKASIEIGAKKGKSDSCANRAWSIDVELDYNTRYNEGYADGYIKSYDEAWESDKSDCSEQSE